MSEGGSRWARWAYIHRWWRGRQGNTGRGLASNWCLLCTCWLSNWWGWRSGKDLGRGWKMKNGGWIMTYSIRSEVATEQTNQPLFTWYYPSYNDSTSIPNPYDQQPISPSPPPRIIFLPPSTQEEHDVWTRAIPPRTRTAGEWPRSTAYTDSVKAPSCLKVRLARLVLRRVLIEKSLGDTKDS